MTTVDVQETGAGELFDLTNEQAAALDRSGLVTVRLADGGR